MSREQSAAGGGVGKQSCERAGSAVGVGVGCDEHVARTQFLPDQSAGADPAAVDRSAQQMCVVREHQCGSAFLLGDDGEEILGHHLGAHAEQSVHAIGPWGRHRLVIAQQAQCGPDDLICLGDSQFRVDLDLG